MGDINLAYIKTHDENKPAGSRARSLGDDDIRELKYAMRERFAADHQALADETGYTNIGIHKKVTLLAQAADPTAYDDVVYIYVKEVGTEDELFYMDTAGNVIQLTSVGKINASALGIGSQATGDLLYADSASLFKRLGIGSAGQGLLVSGGKPAWGTPATSKHIISRGFELTYKTNADVYVEPGTLYHNITEVNKTARTILTLATTADWWDGNADSYAGGAGWCYIGVKADGISIQKSCALLTINEVSISQKLESLISTS